VEVTAMEDPNFVVQGLWSDGRIAEEDGADELEKAIKKAERLCASPLFEGTAVRVITRDGELQWAWESPKHGGHPTIARMKAGWTSVCRLQACFKSDSGEDFLVFGDVNLPPVLSNNCGYEALPTHVQVDDPGWHFPVLDRALSEKEEQRALEALYQEAVKRVMACN
jgi:hypothetical protein